MGSAAPCLIVSLLLGKLSRLQSHSQQPHTTQLISILGMHLVNRCKCCINEIFIYVYICIFSPIEISGLQFASKATTTPFVPCLESDLFMPTFHFRSSKLNACVQQLQLQWSFHRNCDTSQTIHDNNGTRSYVANNLRLVDRVREGKRYFSLISHAPTGQIGSSKCAIS